ncbi:hypothetical protein VP01_10628g1, partial [Puccinia sorghi]
YQNPNQSHDPQYSGKMYNLGWQKGYEEASKIGIKGIAENTANKTCSTACMIQPSFDSQSLERLQRIQMDITSSKAMFLNKKPSFANSSTWFPVLYFMKSRSNKMPLKHLD